MTRIRVLVAEDHTLMREGLKRLFALVTDIVVAGEAASGAETLERVTQGGIDLLLLDLTMPKPCGEDLIADIRERCPMLPILVLSMHNEARIAQRALSAGADGYVAKDSEPVVLLDAVRQVAAGHHFLDPSVAQGMPTALDGTADDDQYHALSKRERQILRMLADGLGVKEIARVLSISDKTVSTHKARLMEKMGLASNADIVKYALAHGLSG